MDNERVVEKTTVGSGDENGSITVTHVEGDYRTPDGFYHYGGVHKVTAVHTLSGRSYARAKTFKGESAWSNAERLFEDLVWKIRREN